MKEISKKQITTDEEKADLLVEAAIIVTAPTGVAAIDVGRGNFYYYLHCTKLCDTVVITLYFTLLFLQILL